VTGARGRLADEDTNVVRIGAAIMFVPPLLGACAGTQTSAPTSSASLPVPVETRAVSWDASARILTCERSKTRLALPEPWQVELVSDEEVHARDGLGAVALVRSDAGPTDLELLRRDLADTLALAMGAALEDGNINLTMNEWRGRVTYTAERPRDGQFLVTFVVPSGDRAGCRVFVLESAAPARDVGASLLQGVATPKVRTLHDAQQDPGAELMRSLEMSRPAGAR
jgi:hypothetical protein